MKPTIGNVVPVLSVGSYEETVSHYVEWLGFKGISETASIACLLTNTFADSILCK
jgi:hypothetical protein